MFGSNPDQKLNFSLTGGGFNAAAKNAKDSDDLFSLGS